MKMRMILTLSLACATVAACGGEANNQATPANEAEAPTNTPRPAGSNLAEALGGSVDHTQFVQALRSAGLIETLEGVGPYTVFAPTNAAFEAIPEESRASLTSEGQREQLITLLSYHIVPGTVTGQDLAAAIERGEGGRAELATVTGANLTVSREGEAIVISDGAGGQARVVGADQLHSNGVVHSVDTVLMPAAAE